MERQLKERLIGAAVLVAAAVIMVPEMFSGRRTAGIVETDEAKPATNQTETYSVDLQATSAPASVAAERAVEPPAERPVDEMQEVQAAATNSDSVANAAPSSAESEPQPVPPVPQTTDMASPAADSVKPSARPEAAKPAASTGWAVQVGSFSAQSTAQQIVTKLKGQGYSAFVGPVRVSGKTLYRVRIGPLADRASADAALQKLRGSYAAASIVAPGR